MEKSGTTTPAFRVIMSTMDIPIFPDGTKREDAINELIDDEQFKETVLKQFNICESKESTSFKMTTCNMYLKICKQFGD